MTFQNINWFNVIFLFLFHIVGGAFCVMYIYENGLSLGLFSLAFALYLLSGISITAGYHRLFSHRAYEAHPILEYFYLIFGAAAFENSALNWCYDHRVHHRYVDKDNDPYNISRGFWYAHIGWILRDEPKKDFPQYKRDLLKNKRILWQDKYFIAIATTMSLILPAVIGAFFGQALEYFLIAGLGRLIVVHHATFFINSLCHMWGKQTYTDENTAKDNSILAFFTYGEGFHNFHHLFHNDYRNGIRWFHFDPTKWVIRCSAYLGLAKKLSVTPARKVIMAKMKMKQKLIEANKIKKCVWVSHIDAMIDQVDESLKDWTVIKEQYTQACLRFKDEKTEIAQAKLNEIKKELAEAKLNYKQAYRDWKDYSNFILKVSYA